jgi:hypothetical protein
MTHVYFISSHNVLTMNHEQEERESSHPMHRPTANLSITVHAIARISNGLVLVLVVCPSFRHRYLYTYDRLLRPLFFIDKHRFEHSVCYYCGISIKGNAASAPICWLRGPCAVN